MMTMNIKLQIKYLILVLHNKLIQMLSSKIKICLYKIKYLKFKLLQLNNNYKNNLKNYSQASPEKL